MKYATSFESFRSEFGQYEMGLSMNEIIDEGTEDILRKFSSTVKGVDRLKNSQVYQNLFMHYQIRKK